MPTNLGRALLSQKWYSFECVPFCASVFCYEVHNTGESETIIILVVSYDAMPPCGSCGG